MKLVIICGPPAVGKMSVGQALAQKTSWKLFHNHMSLELVNQFFDFGTPHFSRLDRKIRFAIFKEIAKSEIEGLIFTIVWAFSEPEDVAYIDEIIQVFEQRAPEVLFVDLKADLKERLKRNIDPHRLEQKPSKRDLGFSEKSLLKFDELYRMNAKENEFPDKNFLYIDNTNLSPDQVAQQIIEQLGL
jgi:shikimate kinase